MGVSGRKIAAELLQRDPEVVEPLRSGQLCLTSVVELAKVLTPENRGDVVARFFHASKQEAKAISAGLRPAEAAPHRDLVTALEPLPRSTPARSPASAPRLELPLAPVARGGAVLPDEPRREAPTCAPVSPPAPTRAAAKRDARELASRAGRGEARRLHPGWRLLPVADVVGRGLWLSHAGGARSHRAGRARGRVHAQ